MKPEKQTTHYRGRIISLTSDEVRLPNGHLASLEVVHHPGGAAAVAIDAQDRVCLLKQYRYVADGWLWELPAGKLEPDEPPLATAQRELVEEAGVSAREWHSLGSYLSSPGVFTEVLASLPRDRPGAGGRGPRAGGGHRGALATVRRGLRVGGKRRDSRRQDGAWDCCGHVMSAAAASGPACSVTDVSERRQARC